MISIVMPVYNTGKYLKESIESLLEQTYGDFELICVDDSSKDDLTLDLLEEYEKKDKRIRVIHLLENVGAAEARNIGLKQANGEYIIFLDADDIFDKDMLEKMHNSLQSSGADMCVCGHREYSESSKQVIRERSVRNLAGIMDRVFCVEELGEEGLMYWTIVPWNKMCRKDFLYNNNIHFQNLSSSNDVFYALMCNLLAEKIVCCDGGRPFVTYRVNHPNQISANRISLNYWYAIQYLLDARKCFMNEMEWRQIMYVLIFDMVDELKRSLNESKRKECYDVIKAFITENSKKLVFESKLVRKYVEYFLERPYESKWFDLVGDFDRQLEEYDDSIANDILAFGKDIVVWGNGLRGQAFQRYCRKRNFENIKVADQKNDAVGSYTSEGYLMIHTLEVANLPAVIVASNSNIYKELSAMECMCVFKIVDLENYCPIG